MVNQLALKIYGLNVNGHSTISTEYTMKKLVSWFTKTKNRGRGGLSNKSNKVVRRFQR
jgi:hypothetical protein